METESLKTPEICGIKDLLPVFEDSQDVVELQFNSNDSLKARKSREGYYTNDDIISQLNNAVDIAQKYFPSDDHAFFYDNATTHTKRPDGSLNHRMINLPIV